MFFILNILHKQLNQPMLLLLWERDDPFCHGPSEPWTEGFTVKKNVACGFSQCDVCYCQEGPVMVFQGLFKTTCPTTEVSKSNARYRNVALSLANIQSIVVCFELSLPSSCPVNLHFCLWFPLWLHRAPSRLACSWNHRRFLWVTRLMTWN